MSKISTIYDKKIGKCLIVRGSEAYAHTTDVLMEVGTITKDHTDSFKSTFILNVLRDVGSSQIAIYDNEELIKIVDWSDSSSAIEIGTGTGDDEIRFSYNVDHNIYAKYLGNKECLPSRSKTLVLNEEIPSNLFTSISFGESPTTTFLTTVTIPVTLNAEGTSTQTLNYYVDGDTSNKQSVSVTTNTPTNVTVTGVDNGLHTINFEFEETVNLAESYNEIVISKGAIVNISSPSILTHSQAEFDLSFAVEDFFGNGITQEYTLDLSYDDEEPISIVGFTNNHFVRTLSLPQFSYTFENIQFTDDSVQSHTVPLTLELSANGSVIDTFSFNLNVTRVTEFSMNLTKPYLVDNESTTITGSVDTASGVLENVAVKIGNATVYTNDAGEYTADFTMTSQYDMGVQARCGDKTVTKTAENVLFYYDRGNLDYNTDTNLSTFIGRYNVAVGTTASPKGIRFNGTSPSQSYIQFKTSVHNNIRIEFDITELVNKEGTKLQGLYPFNGLKVNDHVLMTKTDKYIVAVNNEWRTSYSLDGSSWFTCQFGRNGSTSRLTANKIKIKRIRV